MFTRKVIQVRKSLQLCIPKQVAKDLGLSKGDTCEINVHPGLGAVVRKLGRGGINPPPHEEVYRGMAQARIAAQEFNRLVAIEKEKVLRALEMSFTGLVIPRVIFRLLTQLQNALAEAVRRELAPVKVLPSAEERKEIGASIAARLRKGAASPQKQGHKK